MNGAGDADQASANLMVFFGHTDRPEIAATFYGTTTNHPAANQIPGFDAAAVHYAHDHIARARQHRP